MTDIPKDFGHAGAAGHESHSDTTDIASALRDVAADLEAAMGDDDLFGWQSAIVVAANTCDLPRAGLVFTVHATAGGAAGPKQVISTGVPAAGQVRVTYDATTRIPTLLFAVADAITACAVQQVARPSGYTTRLTQAV